MDFGSLSRRDRHPVRQCRSRSRGIIDSVDYVLSGITAVAGNVLSSFGS
ncbi:hypothetical protein GS505_22395 [Rhodococcus hoagii]|uniref:Uncharacterized protein n=1 Tax=Rhodococcus hoagii TaxID=43767 RepID=A0AAE4ZLB3_RHOHA|nr:hypothetical protein [Prescottella equi]